MQHSAFLFLIVISLRCYLTAPVEDVKNRQGKALTYLDYIQPDEGIYNYEDEDNDVDYVSMALEENQLSRTMPASRKRTRPYNSPIYYIRLPPQPYMFVPGVGYVSQQPPPAIPQMLNLPVSFVSNGKPATIYQWGSALAGFSETTQPPPKVEKPKPADSEVHRLPGQFAFNGKPNDIFVLRDSYNSLYGDALQNFYP